MTSVHWTPQAIADLEEVEAHIAKDSPRNARRMVHRITDAAAGLATFPDSGSPSLEYEKRGAREIFVGWYRIIYLHVENEVRIYGVTHGAQAQGHVSFEG